MNLTAWLTLVGIYALGAKSPGPSLAMVLKHTLAGSRRRGMIAGAVLIGLAGKLAFELI